MKNFKLLSLLFIIVAVLSACATLPASKAPHNSAMSWQARSEQLSRIHTFTVRGLINIHAQNKTQSANVVWVQKRQEYTMSLFGPLGMGGATLIGKPQKVMLEEASGQVLTSTTPEGLIEQAMGWTLPVSNLYFWIRGLPAPNASYHAKFDQFNHLSDLMQQGWGIKYNRYTAVGPYDLPSSITMKQNGIQTRLIISQWQLSN